SPGEEMASRLLSQPLTHLGAVRGGAVKIVPLAPPITRGGDGFSSAFAAAHPSGRCTGRRCENSSAPLLLCFF
ncbi:MAG: hypothetical protein K2P27_09145, partial [Lachnospiraceae bacterium]|nr:hypothetical protein [Lachnospiraceae bacterium]